MRKQFTIFLILIFVLGLMPVNFSSAADLSTRLKGRILLQVESKGEAWYVNPDNEKKYYLGRPADAFQVMRELGLGISNKDFDSFNGYAPGRLSGKILLKIEDSGKAYYINPVDLKMHYLGRPSDAFAIMRNLGLGISNNNLGEIVNENSENTKPISNIEIIKRKPEFIREFSKFEDSDGDLVPDSIDAHPSNNQSIINKIYKVKDDATGNTFSIRVNVSLDWYNMYKVEFDHDLQSYDYLKSYVLYDDPYIQDIVVQVIDAGFNHGANWFILFRNLVNQIVYNEDKFTGYDEYPKYPTETIVDGSGDCEDTSILLAALVKGLLYRVETALPQRKNLVDNIKIALLVLPDAHHAAVGYYAPGFDEVQAKYGGLTYYTDNDVNYYYVETTSNDLGIGVFPSQISYKNSTAHVYQIK